ncbi:MAG: PKD domain-containing protein, partial [Planctomycetota bacterium]
IPDGTAQDFSFTPNDNGVYTFDFTVTDDDLGSHTDTVVVTATNVAPTADAGADQTVDEGDPVSFSGSFTDPGVLDTHTIQWNFGDGDTATGSLTPGHTYADNDVYTVTLTVTDNDGGVGVDTLTVTVGNVAPTVNAGPDRSVDEGDLVSFSGSFTDPGVLDTHTIQWNFGDGNTATGSLTPPDHTYADNGVYVVTLRVTDDDGGVGVDTLTVTVGNVAPTVNAGPDQTVNEGAPVSFSGSFTDPGAADTHSIQWDFGDGSTATGSLTPNHIYADDDTYTVTLTVTDDDGGVGIDTLTVTVNNVAPTVNAGADRAVDEADLVSFVGSFTDPSSVDTHTILWDFGDGNTASGSLISSHVYADNGPYVVTLTVTDDDGGEGFDTLTVTVSNVAPTVDAGADQAVSEGDLVSFVGSFTDPSSVDTHLIQWNFGDGNLAFGSLATSHAYADNGIYTVILTVFDDDLGVGTDTLTVIVNNVAPTVNAGPDQTVGEGAPVSFAGFFTDPGTADTHTILWNFGDGGSAFGSLSPSHAYAADGLYTVTLSVMDDDAGLGTDNLVVTVNNVAPTADAGGPYFVGEGSNITLNGFGSTDPGNDIVLYQWDLDDNGVYDVSGPTAIFNSTDDGEFTVRLLVTDEDGAWDVATATVTVGNVTPSAEAGGPYYVNEGSNLTLDASASTDPGLDIVSFEWDLDNNGSYETPGTTAIFNRTDDGPYTVGLRVTDDFGAWDVDTAIVIVTNVAPTAEAGGPYFVDEGGNVVLDGSNSTDPGNDIGLYQWDLDGDGVFGETGPSAGRGNEWGVNPTFSAAGLAGPSSVVVSLRVTDDTAETDADEATVWIAKPLGPVDFLELNGLNPLFGDLWYSLETTHEAILTIESLDVVGGAVTLYDENVNPLPPGGLPRVDQQVGAGEKYYFKVSGTGSNVDLRLANLVSHVGTAVTVYGTDGDDLFEFDAAASRLVTINGVAYHFTDAEAGSISFDGGGDYDTAVLTGGSGDERATLWSDHGTLTAAGNYTVEVTNVEAIMANGGGGTDTAVLYDSSGSDRFEGRPDLARMTFESGAAVQANDFRYAFGDARNGGTDTADLYGVIGQQDTFKGYADQSMAYGSDFYSRAKYFDVVNLNSVHSDRETAALYDSDGSDTFEAWPDLATMTFESGAVVHANDFRYAFGVAKNGGTDTADLYGSSGQRDKFKGYADKSMAYGSDFHNQANSFEVVNLNSVHSDGEAVVMIDSAGSDTFEAWPNLATMTFESGAVVHANDFYYAFGVAKNGGTY